VTIKVALIPPLGWEQYLLDSTGVQMALAIDSCMAHPHYRSAFTDMADRGDLVIVDNGEAEGMRNANHTVTDFAMSLKATEQVLPDVMGDRVETIRKVHEFFLMPGNYWSGMDYMLVLQGDLYDAQTMVHWASEFTSGAQTDRVNPITTLGIPRNMGVMTSNSGVRIDMATWIATHYPNKFQIHLLGAQAAWPQELKFANKYAGDVIRSIDTAMPFNYALAGVLFETGEIFEGARDRLYLKGTLPRLNVRHVARNIEVYKSWAA